MFLAAQISCFAQQLNMFLAAQCPVLLSSLSAQQVLNLNRNFLNFLNSCYLVTFPA